MDQIVPPEKLSLQGNLAENWRRFKQHFEIYLIASGIGAKAAKVQAMTLLHVAGPEAVEIYNTFVWAAPDDSEKLQPILDQFQGYCNPRKNVTYERHIFFTRNQVVAENIDAYVTDLKLKAKSCEFGDLQDSLVRDKIVCGIRHDQVRGRLLRETDLTLEKAVGICRAAEASATQIKNLSVSDSQDAQAVHAVKSKKQPYRKPGSSGKSQPQGQGKCRYCGYTHKQKKCPAQGETCYKCQKANHFASVCRSAPQSKDTGSSGSKVHTLEEATSDMDDGKFFMEAIQSKVNSTPVAARKPWLADLHINDHKVKVKLDTGSDCNAMSRATYDSISRKPFQRSKARLVGYFGEAKKAIGKATITVCNKNKYYVQVFQIMEQNVTTVLGGPTCEEMGLVKRVYTLNEKPESTKPSQVQMDKHNSEDILEQYQEVFSNGLGKLEGKHTIKVDLSVPAVVHAPRKIPFALRDKVRLELERMEKGVIEKVTEPTDWVNSMVVVEKPNKVVRICLDPRDLNKAIKREQYPMKTIEEVAAKLSDAKIFSVLDAGQAFWQIELDEDSSQLVTFNTPFGRYKFKRLPYGIKSAPEVFQKRLSQMLEDIEGTEVIMDDILVYGKDKAEHDSRLRKVLDKVQSKNLKLGKSKCKIGLKEVKYIGHIIGQEGLKADSEKIEAITQMQSPTCKSELQRFMGMVNYLAKFIPNMSSVN